MTPSEFIDRVRTEVRDAAASDVLQQLQATSGRRPKDQLRRLSSWFRGLSAEDQATLAEIAGLISHYAVFGFLSVLDGARVVERTAEKGSFRLLYEKDGHTVVLTNGSLHELFNAE